MLQSRLPGLFCRLIEPVFEMRLAQLRVIVRNQCPLAHRDPDVARVRVRDYLARILARSRFSGPSPIAPRQPAGGLVQ